MKQAHSYPLHYRNTFWLAVAGLALTVTLFLGSCCHRTRKNGGDYRIRTHGGARTSAGNKNLSSSSFVPNMNGEYRLSMTPGGGPEGLFPQHFSQYPHYQTRHFDVYSPPIRSLYSQVFWKSLDPVRLPQPIVDEFHSKIMAIVGFEVDQVLTLSNGTEVSIPMNAIYNHHYECTMTGGDTNFELITDASNHNHHESQEMLMMGHGKPLPYWKPSSPDPLDSQEFRGANGGEMRQSFHGYAPGFAQMIRSPQQFQVIPMQIDTWHRDQMSLMDGSRTRFFPGPLPKSSLAPIDHPLYSGLLECPVTTRITKHLPLSFQLWNQPGSCPRGSQAVETPQDCFDMVSMLLSHRPSAGIVNRTGTTLDRPLGCSVSLLESHNDNNTTTEVILAFFNSNNGTATTTTPVADCTSSQTRIFRAHSPPTSLPLEWSLQVDTESNEMDFIMTGPIDVWFAIGFGAQAMKDEPWTIVIEPTTPSSTTTNGSTTKVSERILGEHAGGSEINVPTLQVLEESTTDTTRTLHLRRIAVGHPYFDVDPHHMTQIAFISAVGSSSAFGYHRAKEPNSAFLLPVSQSSSGGTCVCQQEPPPFGQTKGATLQYHPVKDQPGEQGPAESVVWNNQCPPAPRGSLLEQRNPTCDVRTYSGGQLACHHMWSLLDAEQEIPWPDQPIEYRLKFRFWFQDYEPSYHTQVQFATWGIASPVEYDVPQCAEGIPGCSQDDSTGQWIHTIQGAFVPRENGRLVAAHFHCHAPTCLSMSLYMCESGTPLEECTAQTGQLLCHQQASYGNLDETNDNRDEATLPRPFQEPGFISVPPCLWGSKEFGLEEPIPFSGKTLFATKTANATFGHHGEMAWMQVHYV